MPRQINHIERISESFDALDCMSKADIVAELFTRLEAPAKAEAYRRMTNHARMSGIAGREQRRRGESRAPLSIPDFTSIGVDNV